ncbi:hypothetical protein LCGC14_0276730 [marine sediment metagenome]|uniref:LamG-like jellyroll fold domain-containing protein n=1 Tax=marine sediment metagenome TaxID=412755 RepID=A0A0F9U286_9ZZZZ|nr:LamG domain-containing protein [Phycisphaerae bacterium]HDZ43998.1 LamG domain-containing protein [Phycisphaerae bacterium]
MRRRLLTGLIAALISTSAHAGALRFDGGEFAKIPDTVALRPSEFTIELWFKAYSTPGSWNHLMTKPTGTGVSDSFWMAFSPNTRMALEVGVDDVELNRWHHVALTATTTGPGVSYRELFLDGIQIDFWEYNPPWPYDDSPVFLGADDNNHDGIGGLRFVGLIDEVRIWGQPRTAAEIQATKDSELYGTEAGLLAYWRLNEGQGQIMHDAVATGSDGLLGYDDLPAGDQWDPAWVTEGAPITPIPEPATMGLLALGGLALLKRKQRQWHGVSLIIRKC